MKVDRTEQTDEAGADVPKVTMKSEIYSISELANEFDVTSRAIRFYEDQGLLNPSRKGRKRIYQERDRVRLKLILRGKRLGFSLADIKEIFDLYDSAPGEEGQLNYLIDIIQTRRAQLEQQRQDIDVVLDEMRWVEKRAKKALRDLQEGKE
ncbi:MAG: MerR family DNA-binding transcriptional regulator [Chromatiales bacterium]|nr:MerR family DNA-binding transcriptional regulator [Chromatiales bacterium]